MSKLDKYFKDKLQNREFEYKDAYWQKAADLIAANERKKRRRRMGWWLSGLVLVLISGAGYWGFFGTKEISRMKKVENSGIVEKTKTNIPTEGISDANQSKEFLKNEYQKPSDKLFKDPSQNIDYQSNTSKNNSGSFSIEANIHSEIMGIGNNSNTKKESTTIQSGKSDKLEKTTPKNLPIAQIETNISVSEKDHLFPRTVKNETGNLFHLPNLIINITSEEKIPQAHGEGELPVSKKENKKITIGLTTGAFLMADNNSTSDHFSGFKAGFALDFPLAKRWSVGTELAYFHFRQDFGPSVSSPDFNFSFGGEYDYNHLIPNSLHFLDVPVLVKYENGRHAFEGGIAIDLLWGAYGNLVFENHKLRWQRTDQENEVFDRELEENQIFYSEIPGSLRFTINEELEKGWLGTKNLNKFQAQILIGYRYRLNKKYDLGIRVHYWLSDFHISDKDFLKKDNKFIIQFSTTFKLWQIN